MSRTCVPSAPCSGCDVVLFHPPSHPRRVSVLTHCFNARYKQMLLVAMGEQSPRPVLKRCLQGTKHANNGHHAEEEGSSGLSATQPSPLGNWSAVFRHGWSSHTHTELFTQVPVSPGRPSSGRLCGTICTNSLITKKINGSLSGSSPPSLSRHSV